MVAPSVSSGIGGVCRGDFGGYAGSPVIAGYAHHPVVQVEEGLERGVVDRPVVGHAVETPHAKVRGAEAREVRAPVDRAPAHRVVHQRRDRRRRVVDRIVLGEPPHVGLGAPVGVAMQLPVGRASADRRAGRPSRPAPGTRRRRRRARASRRRRRQRRRRRSRARRPDRPRPRSAVSDRVASRTVWERPGRIQTRHRRHSPGVRPQPEPR